VVLYTCASGTAFGSGPGPFKHPCGSAAKALDDAEHRYEIKNVGGGSLMFWTWPTRARDRAEVKQLSGRHSVPILVLDEGDVIAGSATIVKWAAEHPASTN
jgi:glutathione S-transferase